MFQSVQPAELTVSALPVSWEPARVRQKLKRLSENSGGKVGMVVGNLATIRFPSIESASRLVLEPAVSIVQRYFIHCSVAWFELWLLFLSSLSHTYFTFYCSISMSFIIILDL